MIRRVGIWLAAFALLAGCDDQGASDQPPPSPILYELANADGEMEGWLFGTVHSLPDGVRWRTPALEDAVTRADSLMVEVASLDGGATTANVFRDLSTTSGLPPVLDRLEGADRERLVEALSEAGLSHTTFAGVEDWAVALALASALSPGDPANGVDRALIADFRGRTIHQFEGAPAQFRIFDALPSEAQRTLLMEAVSEAGEDPDKPAPYLVWLTGDADALEDMTTDGMLADPALRKALLIDRNRAWSRRLASRLESEGPMLVAVGAAHLPGPDGLVALMEERGYTATRIQ
ncbi:TraB/GumN family protein [Qipengyuania sp. JC766]|uniref:TraB/GumN family protein n=1 Tax=Qipengyuania sp. JC766 TaxID=3232139 RepID=UPI0034588030